MVTAIPNQSELPTDEIHQLNGWTCPPTSFQIISWITLLYFCSMYFAVIVPALPSFFHLTAYLIYGSLFGIYLILYILIVSLDPGHYQSCLDPAKIDGFCHKCGITVSSGLAHCTQCHKCIKGYDHHCDWLNNCIGKRNYRFFVSLLVCGVGGMLVHIIASLYLIIMFFFKHDQITLYEEHYLMFGYGFSSFFWIATVTMAAIFGLMGFCTFSYLVGLHIFLKVNNWTTSDFLKVRLQKLQHMAAMRSQIRARGLSSSHQPHCTRGIQSPIQLNASLNSDVNGNELTTDKSVTTESQSSTVNQLFTDRSVTSHNLQHSNDYQLPTLNNLDSITSSCASTGKSLIISGPLENSIIPIAEIDSEEFFDSHYSKSISMNDLEDLPEYRLLKTHQDSISVRLSSSEPEINYDLRGQAFAQIYISKTLTPKPSVRHLTNEMPSNNSSKSPSVVNFVVNPISAIRTVSKRISAISNVSSISNNECQDLEDIYIDRENIKIKNTVELSPITDSNDDHDDLNSLNVSCSSEPNNSLNTTRPVIGRTTSKIIIKSLFLKTLKNTKTEV